MSGTGENTNTSGPQDEKAVTTSHDDQEAKVDKVKEESLDKEQTAAGDTGDDLVIPGEKEGKLVTGTVHVDEKYTFAGGVLEVSEDATVKVVDTDGDVTDTQFTSDLLKQIEDLTAKQNLYMCPEHLGAIKTKLAGVKSAEYQIRYDLESFNTMVETAEGLGTILQEMIADIKVGIKVKDQLFVAELKKLVARFSAALNVIAKVYAEVHLGITVSYESDYSALTTNMTNIDVAIGKFGDYIDGLTLCTDESAKMRDKIITEVDEMNATVKAIQDMSQTTEFAHYAEKKGDQKPSPSKESVIDAEHLPKEFDDLTDAYTKAKKSTVDAIKKMKVLLDSIGTTDTTTTTTDGVTTKVTTTTTMGNGTSP